MTNFSNIVGDVGTRMTGEDGVLNLMYGNGMGCRKSSGGWSIINSNTKNGKSDKDIEVDGLWRFIILCRKEYELNQYIMDWDKFTKLVDLVCRNEN